MSSHSQHEIAASTSLYRNRNFLLLWCAYAVSALGDHLSEMAILKTQNALSADTNVTSLVAKITFAFFAPFLLIAPFAGLLADRLPRRGIMMTADIIRCVILFFFAGLILTTQSWGSWGPVLPLALVGLFAALFSPARSSLLPTLVHPDQLIRANGLIAGLGIVATMGAAKLGGHLADHYHPDVSFRTDAATFLVSAALLFFIKPPRQSTITLTAHVPRQPSFWHQLRDGLRYCQAHRHVRELLMVAAIIWFCGALVNSVIPAVVRDVYKGTYVSISNYRAYLGVGFILGSIIISTLGQALRAEIAITWGLIGVGSSAALFAASVFLPFDPATLAWIGAIAVTLAGLFAVAVMASFDALLQRSVANRYLGRVFGVKDIGCVAALLLATGVLGVPLWPNVDQSVGFILLGVAALSLIAGYASLNIRLKRGAHNKGLTFAENLNEFIARFWWRLTIVGPTTIPREGPVIVTANHTCAADPLFLCAAAPYRSIAFMVAKEFMQLPIARWFMGLVHCIPVRRDGSDTAATKQAMRLLRNGNALGIFIEGRIVPPGEQADPKDGVAMLALRTGAKVIPVHISGLKYHDGMVRSLLARHRATLRFGKPLDLAEFGGKGASRDQIRAATKSIVEAIKALAPNEPTIDKENSTTQST